MNNIFDSDKIAVSPIIISRDKVENLTDRPNNSDHFGGDSMTSLELKKAFDKIGVYIATRLKNLIEALKSGDAGSSIGILGWNGELTNIKSMIMQLRSIEGISNIGTSIIIDGEQANLQGVIDNLYTLIASYELDDIYDIKNILQYEKESGQCVTIDEFSSNLTELNELATKLREILSLNGTDDNSVRLDNIQSDINAIESSVGQAFGIARLDGFGKVLDHIDASRIVSGVLPLSCIPDAAYERTYFVATEAERFALTKDKVQNGDIVVVEATQERWYKVIDDTKLNVKQGYREIVGGISAVAKMAQEYDVNYHDGGSIADKFAEQSASVEVVRDRVIRDEGANWNGETIASNNFEIQKLKGNSDVYLKNKYVYTSSFGSSSRFEDYGFECIVQFSQIKANSVVELYFNHAECISGIFSPFIDSYNGYFKLYANEKPKSDFTIPLIIVKEEYIG